MKTHGPLLAFGILIIIILGVFGLMQSVFIRSEAPAPTACTTEAKICPDGSAVGRSGPQCEFAECPTIATTTPLPPIPALPEIHACNQDAKKCPDGSSVSRVGTDCHFAECPLLSATSGTIITTLGQKMTALNVSVTPIEVLEDSRCPQDVQCVWAGTVRIKALVESALGSDEATLEMATPLTTEAEEVVLAEVSPAKTVDTDIPASSYRFTFTITKR